MENENEKLYKELSDILKNIRNPNKEEMSKQVEKKEDEE